MNALKLTTGLLLPGLLLSACAVGPNFHKPAAPVVKEYTHNPIRHTITTQGAHGRQQTLVQQDIPAQWWQIFHNKALNQLIVKALHANPDIHTAQAGLRAAQENVLAQKAAYYPSVVASVAPTRHLTAGTLASLLESNAYLYNLTTPQLTVSYVPDVFGGNRRRVESLVATAQAQRFQMEAISLTVVSNLVKAVIQVASLQAQITATQHSIDSVHSQLALMKKAFALGQIGAVDVGTQQTLLAQIQATLPALKLQLAQQQHVIASLCGDFAAEVQLAQIKLTDLQLPKTLPVSLPWRLVEQRPDIRIAEAQMHAASAQIGIAVANRLPNIILTADAGNAAVQLSTLFSSVTKFWDLAALISQPVFNAGALRHQQRAAVALYQQSYEQYRGVILASFQNVADTLKALEYDAEQLHAANAALNAAHKNLKMTRLQWEVGGMGYLSVLNAQQVYQQAMLLQVQSEASRLLDSVALFQALGGGWWNRPKVCI